MGRAMRKPEVEKKSRVKGSLKTKKADWHSKIAANRGEKWRKNMLAGRRAAQLNPSNIRLIRLKLNIQQSSLAHKIQVSTSTFGAIERGKQMVKKSVAELIASELQTSINKLFKPALKKKFIALLQKSAV